MTVPMDHTWINGRWLLRLPEHRAKRPEWPWWEAGRLAAEHHVITNMNRPTVWSVGAEEGDFPALYSSWGADVALIEPNPLVWPNIKIVYETNRLRDPVASFVGLVGDPDMVNMTPPECDVFDPLPHIAGRTWPECADGPVIGDHGFRHLMDGRATTPTTTINDLWTSHGFPNPDVITMDIEGGEYRALLGARYVIDECRPVVFVSIHPGFMDEMYGDEPADIFRLMATFGYTGTFITYDHEAHYMFTP